MRVRVRGCASVRVRVRVRACVRACVVSCTSVLCEFRSGFLFRRNGWERNTKPFDVVCLAVVQI